MDIHEHQAKTVLKEFGVPVPRGFPAFSVADAVQAAQTLGGPIWVVKAQIHAGGRGKGGGVKLVKSIDEVRAEAERMLGMTLVTHQTGPKGKVVRRLYIEEGAAIARELYLSLLVDRETSEVAVVASTEGGMDIEEVAKSTPEKIVTFSIDPVTGVFPHHGLALVKALKLEGPAAKQARPLLEKLYAAFTQKDMSLLEVNPLIVTQDGDLKLLDAKISFDANALFRHDDIRELRDDAPRLFGGGALQLQRLDQGQAVVREHPGGRIDGEGDDLLGGGAGHLLDVHAALGGGDHRNARGLAVHQHRQIEFPRDRRAFLDIEAAHHPALGPGLVGDQGHAQHAGRLGADVLYGLDHLDPAALAAPAGVDLGLHHPDVSAQGLGRAHGVLDGEGGNPSWNGKPIFLEDGLGLVLVDIHRTGRVGRPSGSTGAGRYRNRRLQPQPSPTQFPAKGNSSATR